MAFMQCVLCKQEIKVGDDYHEVTIKRRDGLLVVKYCSELHAIAGANASLGVEVSQIKVVKKKFEGKDEQTT